MVWSGANTQKSASCPTAMLPLAARPARLAGAEDIHLATSQSEKPRDRAPLQTSGRLYCNEEIPPQAASKSRPPPVFISSVHGEWSDTTRSSVLARIPSQSSSRLAASRIGGD